MASGAHFGCLKFTFDRISGHFRPIRNFNFCLKFLFLWICFRKWLPSAILDVRNSLWITFLTISDQYRFFIFFYLNFFYKMADVGHSGCPNFTFDRISGHFRSIRNFILFWNFWQNGWRRPFWMSEIHFRSHFWPFQIDMQLFFFLKFLTKWLPEAIMDVWNSISISFLAISEQSAILNFRNSLSIAILAISDRYRFWMSENHFGSIRNFIFYFIFLTKWPLAAILDVRK